MGETKLEKSVEVTNAIKAISEFDLKNSNSRYGGSTGKSAASIGFRFIDYLCFDDYDLVGQDSLIGLEQRCWDDLDDWISNTNSEGFNWDEKKPDFFRSSGYKITWTDEYSLGIEAPIYDVLEYRDNLCKDFYEMEPNVDRAEELEDIYAAQQEMIDRKKEIVSTIKELDVVIIGFGEMLSNFKEWVGELKTHWDNHIKKDFVTIVHSEWDEDCKAFNDEFRIVEAYDFDDHWTTEGWHIYNRELDNDIKKAAEELDKEDIFHLCKQFEKRAKKEGILAAVNTLKDWRIRETDNWEFENNGRKYSAA